MLVRVLSARRAPVRACRTTAGCRARARLLLHARDHLGVVGHRAEPSAIVRRCSAVMFAMPPVSFALAGAPAGAGHLGGGVRAGVLRLVQV
jgi:hypothetical protein